MATASQDINYFIERQRSKLNKTNGRPANNRSRPMPPRSRPLPLPPPRPLEPVESRLDFQVARMLDEPSPRLISQQGGYIPPSSRSPYPPASYPEQQQPYYEDSPRTRRFSNGTAPDNQSTFYDKFGTYDERRSQLKDDLKREYNEYLQSQQGAPRRKATAGPVSSGARSSRRVQFQGDPTVIAPWEKDGSKSSRSNQNYNDVSSSNGISTAEYITNSSRSRLLQEHDEQYIRDREEYIIELENQIYELETRKRQIEINTSKLSSTTSSIMRAHYAEDLRALNNLLAERLHQRDAIDPELTRILNRRPIGGNPALVGSAGLRMPLEQIYEPSSQTNQQFSNERPGPASRRDNKPRPRPGGGFQIGDDVDKDAEQVAKKRYQQELQAQIREGQMRKAQAKQEKDEYDRKLEAEIQRYSYFGRSGGGAPMRDKDGNVVANLADLRNPPQQSGNLPPQSQSHGYLPPSNPTYSTGVGASSITGGPFYNPPSGQYQPDTARTGTPNHGRGAGVQGILGTVKTEEQIIREEKYKQELRNQIEEKRLQNIRDITRRRAEEEQELAKHAKWQEQMEKQQADDASKKHEKEAQERHQQQQLEEDLERQRQNETKTRRQPERLDGPSTSKTDDQDDDRENTIDAQAQYRSSSPPVPTLSKREATPARKKPPSSYRRPRPIRTNSMTSLRSDGSDSELLNRLELLKRQLKDKEDRLRQHAHRQRTDAAHLSDIEEKPSVNFRLPSPVAQPPLRRLTPEYLLSTTRLDRRRSPLDSDRLLRVLQNEDDDEYKPSYFRDDSILMRGTGGFVSPSKRVDLVDGMFVTNLDDSTRRRRHGWDPTNYFDRDNPTSMANLELNRIAEQNEQRLKKLRALEKDDTSLLDNNEVLERFQQKQRLQRRESLTTLQDDAWFK